MRVYAAAVALVAMTAACSKNPGPAAPQPAPAAPPAAPAPAAAPAGALDLSGAWTASVDAGGQTIPVDVTLTKNANGYSGEAAPQGQPGAQLTTLTVQGDQLSMTFAAPDGDAVFAGTMSADRKTVQGTITYNGQILPFTMTKRQP